MDTIVDVITTLPPKSVPLIAVLFAYILIEDLDPDKKEVLASFLFNLASVISSVAIYEGFARDFLQGQTIQQMRQDINELRRQYSSSSGAAAAGAADVD